MLKFKLTNSEFIFKCEREPYVKKNMMNLVKKKKLIN
jgi:hypothetical protein